MNLSAILEQARPLPGGPASPGAVTSGPSRKAAEAACEAFFAKAAATGPLSAEQRDAMRNAVVEIMPIGSGRLLARRSSRHVYLHLVVDGWTCRSRMLPDGGRQITDIFLPGDICTWGIAEIDDAGDDLRACGPARVALLRTEYAGGPEGAAIRSLLECARHAEALALRDRLVSLGRRGARARIADLIVDLYRRLDRVDRVQGGSFRCPMTQEQLADVLGLTSVHVNRMLRSLRDDGIITFNKRTVVIQDFARLQAVADLYEVNSTVAIRNRANFPR